MACWSRQDSLIGTTTFNRMSSSSKRKKPAKKRFGRHFRRLFASDRGGVRSGDDPVEQNGMHSLANNDDDPRTADLRLSSRPSRGRTASGSISAASGLVRRAFRALSGSRSTTRNSGRLPLLGSNGIQPNRGPIDLPTVHETAAEIMPLPNNMSNGAAATMVGSGSVTDYRKLNENGPPAQDTTLENSNGRSLALPSQVNRNLNNQVTMDCNVNHNGVAASLANYSVPFLDAARSQPMSKHHRNRLKAALTSTAADAEELDSLPKYWNDFAALFSSPTFIQYLRAQEVLSESFCGFLSKLSDDQKKQADAGVAPTDVPGGTKAFTERVVAALEKRSEFAYYCFLFCLMLINRSDLARYVDAEASKTLSVTIQSQPQLCGDYPEPILERLVWLAMGKTKDSAMTGRNSPAAIAGGSGGDSVRSRPPFNVQTSISESFKRMHLQDDDKRHSSLYIEPYAATEVGGSSPQSSKLHPDYFNLMTKPDFSNTQTGPFYAESEHVYRMQSRPRGGALIINIVDFAHDQYSSRTGSEVDGENLERLMRHLGFQLFEGHIFANQDSKQIKSLMRRFCNWKSVHAAADACFVAILTHGEHSNKLFAYDGLSIHTTWFEKELASVPELAGKPKIFLFVACRGDEYDNGVPVFQPPASHNAPTPLPAAVPQSHLARQSAQAQRRSTLDIQAAVLYAENNKLSASDNNGAVVPPKLSSNKSSNDAVSYNVQFDGGSGNVSAVNSVPGTAVPLSASSLTRDQGNMARCWTYVRPGIVEQHRHHAGQQEARGSKRGFPCGNECSDDVDGTKDMLTTTADAAGSSLAPSYPIGRYQQVDLDAVADALGDPTKRSACKTASAGGETTEESETEEVAATEQSAAVMSSSHPVGLNAESIAITTTTLSSTTVSAEELNISRAIFQPPQSVPALRRVARYLPQVSTVSTANASNASSTMVAAHMIAVQPNRDSSTVELRSAPPSAGAPAVESAAIPPAIRIPLYADQCAIYSSYPNHRSLRNINHGTWFINMLIKVILAYGHVEDLSSLITKVNQRVSQIAAAGGEKSISQFTSTFTKRLYFNPHHPPQSASLADVNLASGDAGFAAMSSSSSSSAKAGRISLVEQLRQGMANGKR